MFQRVYNFLLLLGLLLLVCNKLVQRFRDIPIIYHLLSTCLKPLMWNNSKRIRMVVIQYVGKYLWCFEILWRKNIRQVVLQNYYECDAQSYRTLQLARCSKNKVIMHCALNLWHSLPLWFSKITVILQSALPSTLFIGWLVYALNFQTSSHTKAHNFEMAQLIDKQITDFSSQINVLKKVRNSGASTHGVLMQPMEKINGWNFDYTKCKLTHEWAWYRLSVCK